MGVYARSAMRTVEHRGLRRGASLPLAFALALAGACSDAAPPAMDRAVAPDLAAEPFRAGIILSSGEDLMSAGMGGRSFNFGQLRDLWIRVKVPAMPPVAFLELEIVAPSGEMIYQSRTPFSTQPAMKEVPPADKDMPPLRVTAAKPFGGGWALDRGVPVRGTSLTRSFEPGTWSVRARVDGSGELSTTFDARMTSQ